MKKPRLLKAGVQSAAEAKEIVDFLYGEYITRSEITKAICCFYNGDELVIKWTQEYGNIMVSQSFLERIGYI